MPTLIDLVWKPSAATPTLPDNVYPHLAPAIYRGDPYTILLRLMNGDDPYEPEGDLFAQIRSARLNANADPGDPLAEFEVTIGGVDGNEVTIHLTPEQTATLPDAGFWDIQEFDGDEPLVTWFTGKTKAWGDITRDEVGS